MDLSKAFDTLYHSILFTKLKYYGIHDNELMWFSCYLTNRQQNVQLGSISSDLKPLFYWGATRFNPWTPAFVIYINDIPQSSQHFKYILYADDTTLFTTVQFRSTTQIDINNELSNVHN